MTALLEVRGLEVGYGGTPVLRGVDLTVEEGEIAVLFGLNGAGKTTTVNTVAGLLRPRRGSIRFAGEEIAGRRPADLVRAGVSLSPEGRLVFPSLTVAENLRLGAWSARRRPRQVEEQRSLVFEYFPRLAERLDQPAGTLSGGEQQMLAIGRALMSRPRLLLIDEASLGLSPVLARAVFEVVSRISDGGTTVLIVEQNAGILSHADRVLMMEKGVMVFEGTGSDVRREDLRQAYLGGGVVRRPA